MPGSVATTTVLDAGWPDDSDYRCRTAARNTFLYDPTGNKVAAIDPMSRSARRQGWDAAGRQTLRIDARGNRTSYVFDGTDQLVGRKYPDGSRVTLAYDSDGEPGYTQRQHGPIHVCI